MAAIPRADSTLAERVKKLEQELRRIKLMPSVVQSETEPEAAAKGSLWLDASAGNEPKVFDGTSWVPARDATIAVAQETADTAQATVDPLVPLTDLAAVTDGTTITGATQESSETGPRVVINDPAYPGEIVLYTGHPNELEPARIAPFVDEADSSFQITGPKTTVGDAPTQVYMDSVAGVSSYQVDADRQHFFATDMTIDGFSSLKLGDGTDYLEILGKAVSQADLSDPSNVFPFRIATGNHLFTPYNTANVLVSQAIVFPVGRFTATPKVVATARTSANATVHVAVASETPTGFTLYFRRADATPTNVSWIAIQD